MTTAYTTPAVVQPGYPASLEPAANADSVGPMAATAAGESTPQRIAIIREQLKLLGDYL
jgi:hypothetical protein